MRAPQHARQAERLAALRSFEILDTPREDRFDRIVELVAALCDAPIAVINLIDEYRQWFKAEVGLGVRETPLETSICSHVILQPGLTVINDTLADPRMCDNPLCFDTPNLRFYAGALLETEDGLPLGTLCVLDTRPRDLDAKQRLALGVLADQVMAQLRLRRELQMANALRLEIDHRVKNSLAMVSGLLNLQARQSGNEEVISALKFAGDRVAAIAKIHDQLHMAQSPDEVDIADFAASLAASLGANSRLDVSITSSVPAAIVKANQAVNVGIILNELVTNALRHGFDVDGSGTITIDGSIHDGRLTFTVGDNGRGLPDGFDPASSSGLGMRLALLIARQNGGELAWSSGDGRTRFSFEIPV